MSVNTIDSVDRRTGSIDRPCRLACTTSALSATRRGPDPNRPNEASIFFKLALTRTPDRIRPTRRSIFLKTDRQGPCRPADRADVVFTHTAPLLYACITGGAVWRLMCNQKQYACVSAARSARAKPTCISYISDQIAIIFCPKYS